MFQEDALADKSIYASWLLDTFTKDELAEKVRLMIYETQPYHVPERWLLIEDEDGLLAEIDKLDATTLVGLLVEGEWYETDVLWGQYVRDCYLPSPSGCLTDADRNRLGATQTPWEQNVNGWGVWR